VSVEAGLKVLSATPGWVYTTKPWAQCDADRRADLEVAWRAGDLRWKLSPNQQDTYDKVRSWQKRESTNERGELEAGRVFGMDSSRRFGKSAIEFILLAEEAIRRQSARCIFIAPEWEQLKQYVFPIMQRLLADAPPHLGIVYKKSDRQLWFPWVDSHIQFVGLDRNPDAARGSAFDMAALDEAGFFDNLEYVLETVLFPQMAGRPWARIFAGSTPPETPDHYWSSDVIPQCIKTKAHDRKTLDQADHYSEREIEEFWNRAGGRKSNRARREYGAEHIADITRAIVPEFLEAEEATQTPFGIVIPGIVREIEPPKFRDCYTAMDPGWADSTGLLFGYWHWELQALVIEDEACRPKENSRRIALTVMRKENALWKDCTTRGPHGEPRPQPYMRVADNDMRLLADLHVEYGLTFMPTDKSELQQHVDNLRRLVEMRKLVIHPRCEILTKQLKHGVWKKTNRKGPREFAEGGAQFGHFDLIAALVYMLRNVNRRRNPAPEFARYFAGNHETKAKPKSKWAAAVKTHTHRFREERGRLMVKTGRTHEPQRPTARPEDFDIYKILEGGAGPQGTDS
jgi:hypothetical protein